MTSRWAATKGFGRRGNWRFPSYRLVIEMTATISVDCEIWQVGKMLIKSASEPKTIDSDYHLQRDILNSPHQESIKQQKPIFSVCRRTQLLTLPWWTLCQDVRPLAGLILPSTQLNALGDRIQFFERNLWRNFHISSFHRRHGCFVKIAAHLILK